MLGVSIHQNFNVMIKHLCDTSSLETSNAYESDDFSTKMTKNSGFGMGEVQDGTDGINKVEDSVL